MSNVADDCPEVAEMRQTWEMLEALMGGTREMREKGESLMPRFPNEDREAHQARIRTATLFPAYRRTVRVMAAKPFSKPVTLSDQVPQQLREWCDDIDLEGVNLHAFAAEMFEEGFYGLAAILVDVPRVSVPVGGTMTVAQQREAGLRPYLVRIKHDQLRGWRVEMRAGRPVFTMFRYCEEVTEPDGDFGTKEVEQIRVLTPGQWATYRKTKDTLGKEEWTLHEQGPRDIPNLGVVPIYGLREGFMDGDPPLEDLAYLNVKHWQSQSDQDTILHVARVPVLAVIGADNGQVGADGKPVPFKLTIGASSAVQLPKGADIRYVEHSGAAIGAGQASLDALEGQMIQAGAELLVRKPGTRTATEAAMDGDANRCDLQHMAQTFEDALDQALAIMAQVAKLPTGGNVTLYADYGASTLDGASAQLIQDWWQGGLISRDTAINELKRRGQLAEEVTAEDEAAKIAEEGPALGAMAEPAAPPQQDPQAQAADLLTKAISRHERHMNGTEPTSNASQMKMMDEMRRALALLTASPPPDNKGAMGGMDEAA